MTTSGAPTQIGRYRLVEVIGTGAYSAVHRAVDERLDDVVAIKVLADNHSLDPEVRERFLTEGRVLRRIDSPHVVAVHDLGETERGQPYLVLEHADRGTLAARVQRLRADGWRPGVDDVLAVVEPLAGALGAIHGAEVVHRDLSPTNVLLRTTLDRQGLPTAVLAGDERLVVADLGLCKDLARHSGMTVAGGTDGFRPPEQRGGPSPIAASADLWSLTALVVWLLSGQPPDERTSVPDVVADAGLPPAFAELLEAGLAADPLERPGDVLAWLDRAKASLGVDPDRLAPRESPRALTRDRRRVARGSRRLAARRWLVGGVAGVALGVGSTLGALSLSGGPAVDVDGAGQVRVEGRDGDATLAIVGPAEVQVGEQVTFRADAEGFDSWVWVDPAGGVVEAGAIDVTASTPGTAVLRLVGFRAGRASLEVDHRLVITDGGG